MKKIKFLICIAAAGLLLTSCNEAAKALPLDYDEIDQKIDTPWVEYSVPATSVTFADGEDAIEINKGATHTYNFTVSPKKANAYGLNWVSNNPDVATIDNGVLTAVGGGEALIVVSSIEEDLFDPIYLEVKVNVPLTGLDVTTPALDLDLEEGEGINFNYVPEDTTDLGVTFTSSNPNVAVVDEEGFVTSVGAGEATITINGKRNISSTVQVTVSDKSTPIESLKLTPEVANLEVEHDLLMDLEINPNKADYELIQWSSDNEDVAKVDENGIVSAIDAGTAHITAKIEYRGRTKTATSTITVFENVADELLLDTNNFELDTSAVKVRQLNAIYKFNGETVSPSRSNLEFISSNESVVIVNESGLVTALSKGSATITARDTKQNLEVVATVNVASSATSITITPSSYKIQPGENVTIKATVAPSNADINIVDWAFSDATLYKNLVVDGNTIKFVAADKEGNLTVTAKIGALNTTATIQVADAAEGFGIIMNDNTKYQADYRGLNEEGYEEYYLPSINFAQGSIFSLYDFASKGRWAVELNPYSFGDTSGTGTFVSSYLSINKSGEGDDAYNVSYNVLKTFKADLYIQILYGSDRLYIELVNGTAPVQDGTYTARIGNNVYPLSKGEYASDVENKIATYSMSGLIVEAGQPIAFYVNDEQITSKLGPSGDDLDNLKYNNYIGTVESGLKVQANASGVSLYVDIWADGGASFWLEGGNSSDHTDSENPVVVDAAYGIKHNGNPLAGTPLGTNDEGYDEYLVKGVNFAANDTFALFDYNTGSSWAVGLNPYSFGDDTGTGAEWPKYLEINEAQDKSYNVSYTVKQAFAGDLYIQIKFQEDRLYVGLVPAEEQHIEVDADYKVAIGADEISMIKQNVELSDEEKLAGKVAVYATDVISNVVKGSTVAFFMDGERVVSHIGPSPDGAESFNNYVGDIANGLKIQADAENVKVYLDIYQDGGASFWIEGGNSDNHTDANIPVVAEGYYLVGSINGWAATDEYKLAVDALDENHYAITDIELQAGSVLKVNDGVSAWFSNGHEYEGCGFTLDEDGNVKVSADGIYTVNFYLTSGDDNHITLEKTGDIPIDTSESVFYLKGTINDWIEKAEFELSEVTPASGHFQIKGMNFAAGDEFKIYDAGTEAWYGNAGTWEGCGFDLSEGGNLIVKDAGTYRVDFYVNGDNGNHITLTKEAFVPVDAVVEVAMGDAEAAAMERKDPDDANCVAKYVLEFDTLTADAEFKFLLDGKVIAVTPNADDTETPLYNNYIGTVKDGYKVQKASDSKKTMELRFWADGGVSFWLPGGDSEDHTDPSIISEGFGLIFGDDTKVLGTQVEDYEGKKQYKISNYHFAKDDTFKLYNFAAKEGWVVDINGASFGGSDEYVSKGATEYTVLQEFYADVYLQLQQNNDSVYFGLKSLTLSADSVTVAVGDANNTIKVSNWGGDSVIATSANNAIATVALGDEVDGKKPVVITGVAAGSTTITVSDGVNSAKITVTVTSTVEKYSISFSINYGTNYGESIYMVGDFSSWGVAGAYELVWNDGNNWTITIIQDRGTVFEFKFAHMSTDNPSIYDGCMEPGSNRTITFDSDEPEETSRTEVCYWHEY